MITFPRTVHKVVELMEDLEVSQKELIDSTGMDDKVVDAVVHQRYTPSPEQRDRVSAVFGVTRHQIIWGHAITPEPHMHAPD
jgi:plasmid maintenance system antidote protein VapI